MSLLVELQRRKVLKVGAAYIVVAWIAVQVASIAFPAFEAPAWALRVFILVLALGFPLTAVLAWILELTPDGVRVEAAPFGNKRVFGSAAALVALAIAWYTIGQPALRRGAEPTPAAAGSTAPAPATNTQRSIAVLPFVDMSQGKDQEYFSDGITEEILNALTRIEGLKVAGRTSSFHFKGRNDSLKSIGAALGVAHVLEGSVRKQGDHVRITAQLIKVDDGFHVWSQNFDRKLDDIFVIQDEISTAIAQALSAKLMGGGAAMPGAASADPVAFDTYLRARQALARRTGKDLLEAADLFAAAAERDPSFAAAWAGRARALSLAFGYLEQATTKTYPAQARKAAERALVLDPGNVEATVTLGYVDLLFGWRWEQGLRGIEAAVARAPNDAEVANFAGDSYRFLGDLENAERWESRAVELDPLFDVNHNDLAWMLLQKHRHREALAAAARALRLDPSYWGAHDVRARTYLWMGEPERARAEIEQLARINPGHFIVPELRARQAIAIGDTAEAHKQLAVLRQRAAAGESLHYLIATIEALLGEHDAAAHSLGLAYVARDPAFAGDVEFMLPECWPEHAGIRAALDKPELKTLFALRRSHGLMPRMLPR